MKTFFIGAVIGVLIGCVVGYIASDVTAYSTTKESERRAFTGGLLVFCQNVQDDTNTRIFTDENCDFFAQQSLQDGHFEKWYNYPSSRTPAPNG